MKSKDGELQSTAPNSINSNMNGSPKTSPANRDLSWKVASNLWVSFQYAGEGLIYAFKTQRNFRIHTFIGILVIAMGLILHLKSEEVAILGLTVGAVVTLELLNTSIESVVDLTVQQSYHELAKIAKDCAAAAVLISALVSIFVAAVLLLPPLINLALKFMGYP